VRALFIHGGGDNAYRYDSERIDWEQTSAELSHQLINLAARGTVIAHSVGAAAVLKKLSASDEYNVRDLFRLAPPYIIPVDDALLYKAKMPNANLQG